jgi:hypothetical protein
LQQCHADTLHTAEGPAQAHGCCNRAPWYGPGSREKPAGLAFCQCRKTTAKQTACRRAASLLNCLLDGRAASSARHALYANMCNHRTGRTSHRLKWHRPQLHHLPNGHSGCHISCAMPKETRTNRLSSSSQTRSVSESRPAAVTTVGHTRCRARARPANALIKLCA